MPDQPNAPSWATSSCVSFPPPTPRSPAATPAPCRAAAAADGTASTSPSVAGGSCGNVFPSVDYAVSPRLSLLGEPVAATVARMLAAADEADASGAADSGSAGGAHAEFSIVWPPTFPVGGSAEVVELRAAVSFDAAAVAEAEAEGAAAAGGAGRAVALAAAVSGCCSRLLAVQDDMVVGDEDIRMIGAGSLDGRVQARLRLHADHPGVTSCILAGEQGIPSLAAFNDAAPLMALPQAARDEAHRLLWRMMHEALPPNHSALPYDPDAFRSPVDLLPPRLQAALSWAWSHHFRAFAHDFSYLLDCTPSPAAAADAFGAPGGEASTAAAAALPADEDAEEVAHYQSVLAQMVCFLRDNDMFACMATLLQTAVTRGLTAALAGADSLSAAAAVSASPLPPPPPSPSAASESSYGPSDVVTAPAVPVNVSSVADCPVLDSAGELDVAATVAIETPAVAVTEATASAAAAGLGAAATTKTPPQSQLFMPFLFWLFSMVSVVRLSYVDFTTAAASSSIVGVVLAFLTAAYGGGGGAAPGEWRWRSVKSDDDAPRGNIGDVNDGDEQAIVRGDSRRPPPSAKDSGLERRCADGGGRRRSALRARSCVMCVAGAVHMAAATWCGAAAAALAATAETVAPPHSQAVRAAAVAAMAIPLALGPLIGMSN